MRTKSAIGLLMGVAIVAWAGTTMGVSFEQAFEPPIGRGPVVLVLSGTSGPPSVKHHAVNVAQLGYYAVLLDGSDFPPSTGKPAAEELRRVIERAQGSPKALPGKVAVIGFSRGGGAALTFAAPMGEVVSAIVAYYPETTWVANMRNYVGQFQVPVLVMAGDRDESCPLDRLRAMEAAAQEAKKPFALEIYPSVGHAFAIPGFTYNEEYNALAWQRTTKMLSQYHPVRAQAAPATPKVQLSSGETVWDLNGDWDAFLENYGANALYGMYPNVYRITQTGPTFSAARMKDNPSPSPGRAGSPSLRGEVDPSGFKQVSMISSGGTARESKGQIAADGKKIVIDDGSTARVTLTRSGDRTPLVGLWRLRSFQREYQATDEREYPMGMSPTGYILFLREGRMAVVITGEGRKVPSTDQDRAGLFNSLVAYTGPYRVDGEKWITMVEVAMNPAWVGAEQTRTFQISGDRLQETSPYMPRPDNRMARAVISYERVK